MTQIPILFRPAALKLRALTFHFFFVFDYILDTTHWGRTEDELGMHWGRTGDALGTHWERTGDALGTHWGRTGDALGTH